MTSTNRFLAVWWQERRNQRKVEGAWQLIVQAGFGLFVTLALVVLVRQSFLGFLDRPLQSWGDGIEAVLIRVCVLVVGWISLDVYGAIVRSPYRARLDLFPVQADEIVRFELIRIAVARAWLVPFFAALLMPIGYEAGVPVWAACVASITGAWLLGLTASALVHLLAVEIAENPAFASTLDLLRGHNPRPQAAFIYAPGAVLLLIGALLIVVTQSVGAWFEGEGTLWPVVFALYLPSALSLLPLSYLANGNWFRASVVISEIDARYATLSEQEDGLEVYLEWLIRYIPESLRVYALRDLRHGWRGRRTWISSTWLFALFGFAAGWSSSQDAPDRAVVVAIGGVWLCCTVHLLMKSDEPAFLKVWLPDGGTQQWAARSLVLVLWMQPCIWGAVGATLLRAGLSSAIWVASVSSIALFAAILTAHVCGRLEKRSVALYGPMAALLAACFMVFFTGGAS